MPSCPPGFHEASEEVRENFANSRYSVAPGRAFSIAYKWHASCKLQSDIKNWGTPTMLRIERFSDGEAIFSLSGRIDTEGVQELQRLLSLEPVGQHIALDLHDVTQVDRDAVKFLACCESQSIELENCPAYVREWIAAERNRRSSDALNSQEEPCVADPTQ